MHADLGVIGVGSMGSMALWQAARRGVRALGFEQFAPGHDRSAAGGETRIFRTAYLEGPEYVPLLQAAYGEWRALERDTGRALLTLTGGLMIGDPDADWMRTVLASIEEFELDHERLGRRAVAERYPQHRLLDGEEAIVDRQAGLLRPEFAVVAASERAESLGARVLRDTPVEAIEAGSDGVRILAAGEEHRVARAIVTTGPWAGRLLGGPEIAAQRLVMTWFAALDPAEFAPERFPIFIRNSLGLDFSGMPSVDGGSVKVALNTPYDPVADPDRLERTVAPERLEPVRRAVRELLPGLVPNPIRVQAYMDGYSPDRHAVVGSAPGAPGVVVLAGFSGHGFKMAPIMGRIAVDLALDGATDLPIAHLVPARFAAVH
jgi:sarcosine oxidase